MQYSTLDLVVSGTINRHQIWWFPVPSIDTKFGGFRYHQSTLDLVVSGTINRHPSGLTIQYNRFGGFRYHQSTPKPVPDWSWLMY